MHVFLQESKPQPVASIDLKQEYIESVYVSEFCPRPCTAVFDVTLKQKPMHIYILVYVLIKQKSRDRKLTRSARIDRPVEQKSLETYVRGFVHDIYDGNEAKLDYDYRNYGCRQEPGKVLHYPWGFEANDDS